MQRLSTDRACRVAFCAAKSPCRRALRARPGNHILLCREARRGSVFRSHDRMARCKSSASSDAASDNTPKVRSTLSRRGSAAPPRTPPLSSVRSWQRCRASRNNKAQANCRADQVYGAGQVLIIGGAGRVGSAVAIHLLSRCGWEAPLHVAIASRRAATRLQPVLDEITQARLCLLALHCAQEASLNTRACYECIWYFQQHAYRL